MLSTVRGKLVTLITGKRRRLWFAGDGRRSVYDKKPQRYAEDNKTKFDRTRGIVLLKLLTHGLSATVGLLVVSCCLNSGSASVLSDRAYLIDCGQ